MNRNSITHLLAGIALFAGAGLAARTSGVAHADTPSITVATAAGGVQVYGSSYPAGDTITLNVYSTPGHQLVGHTTTIASLRGFRSMPGRFNTAVSFNPEAYCYSGTVLVEAVDTSNPKVLPVDAVSPYVPC